MVLVLVVVLYVLWEEYVLVVSSVFGMNIVCCMVSVCSLGMRRIVYVVL